MSYRTLIAAQQAKLLDKKGAQIEGHLIGAKTRVGKYESTIYTVETPEGPATFWGNGRIDSVLLDEKGKGVNPELMRVKIRVTCTDERTVKKGKQTKVYRDHKVEADFADKLGAKTYGLRKA